MPGPTPPQVIANEQFTEPVQVNAPRVQPSLGLYQPCFPITEADYLRLKESNSVLAGLGGAGLSFGISDGLPVIAMIIRGEVTLATTPLLQILLPTAGLIIGVVLLSMSGVFAGGRRRVMARIKQHFDMNPGTMEVRQEVQR